MKSEGIISTATIYSLFLIIGVVMVTSSFNLLHSHNLSRAISYDIKESFFQSRKEYIVNDPVMFEGMIPVKWIDNIEYMTDIHDPDWYDYNISKWANAKTSDGSYWVWIPRFSYKIESCYHMNKEECLASTGNLGGEVAIDFLKGTTNRTYENKDVDLVPIYSGSSQTNFIKHPAFTFGEEEIEGFWIAKFEVSVADRSHPCVSHPNETNCDDNTIIPQVVPDVSTWRYATVSTQFDVAKNIKNVDVYGWENYEVDSHLTKNNEWGAFALLSNSLKGANRDIYLNNSADYITGCAAERPRIGKVPGCPNPWNTDKGVKASTTFNMFGVYDASGCSSEYVAAVYTGAQTSYGESLNQSIIDDGDKYVDIYDSPFSSDVYGDAMYETSNPAVEQNSWYGDRSEGFRGTTRGYLRRGGIGSLADMVNVFYYWSDRGDFYHATSFRISLVPVDDNMMVD